jgi:hypothetical protein
MNKEKQLIPVRDLVKDIPEADADMIESSLYIDWIFCQKEEGWGITSWRHINPRSIKDKIILVFKNIGKKLHFSEVANHVLDDFNSHKIVTRQAIHNELIRHDEFALIGRGEYGLKEWGMVAGTVSDVIIQVLKEHNGPMQRRAIIEAVQKKRDIRETTISLNLQKYPFFERIGRAVYEFNVEKEKSYIRLPRGRKPLEK